MATRYDEIIKLRAEKPHTTSQKKKRESGNHSSLINSLTMY